MIGTEEKARAASQAKAQLDSITEMIENLRIAVDADNSERIDTAQQTIQEDALSVEVRSDWHNPCDADVPVMEYTILLCTGGPAVRIIGELDKYAEPETARIEFQDWYIPWEDYPLTDKEQDIVIAYAQNFYFGG